MRRIVLFGAGENARTLLKIIKDEMYESYDDVVAIADNDSKKWDNELYGIRIIRAEQIPSTHPDMIVIACVREHDSIRKQIKETNGLECIPVVSGLDYIRSCYAKQRYAERYGSSEYGRLNKRDDLRVVVYTAITGAYDTLNEPAYQDDRITYVCFTDSRDVFSDRWNMEYLEKSDDPRMQAKRIKFFPDNFFREYDLSVWVDGKYEIKDNILSYIDLYQRTAPMVCFPHFERKCVYDEAATCISMGVGDKKKIVEQICTYYSEGYPFDQGLYEMGCIVRKHNDEFVKHVMRKWWNEVLSFSNRDQISFPYVCWKSDFSPDICDLYIERNQWLEHHPHNKT